MKKLINRLNRDGLLPHKVGLIVGGVIGILVGLYISDLAEDYEVVMLTEDADETSTNTEE